MIKYWRARGLDLQIEGLTFTSRVVKETQQKNPEALHVIIPHRSNWALTEAVVRTYSRLTERALSVTVVNNFDTVSENLLLLQMPHLTLISNQLTFWGKIFKIFYKKE